MKAVHFGAGNIGRGFVGIILKQNHYDLTFVDVNDEIVQELKSKKYYKVKILNKAKDEIIVENIDALDGIKEEDKVIEELLQVDLITTSLGQDNLKFITDTVIAAIKRKIANNIETNLDIIACENGIKVSTTFKTMIYEKLNSTEKAYTDKYIGFVDSAVDRIVPEQINKNILDVQVEEDFEWVVNKDQIKQNLKIKNIIYTDNLLFFNTRKLLTVNFAHAYIGYMGYQKGYKYVSESLEDNQIYKNAKDALLNIKTSLTYDFKFSLEEQDKYIVKTLTRFQNPLIIDEVTRVARNPKTKLAKNERFIEPLLKLKNHNQDASSIIKAIAYALKYDYIKDQQAIEIQHMIKEIGLFKTIENITGIDNPEIIEEITDQYNEI